MRFGKIAALLVALAVAAEGAGEDWMSRLDGGRSLATLTLPGTHDAGARFEPLPGTIQCQTLTLGEQLAAGVRFLDIRCRHMRDGFRIYHGSVDQKLTFEEVLATTLGFLDGHPGETVVMSIKPEHKPAKNTRGFEETFEAYVGQHPDRWWLAPRVPKLREARGKIVLFRRFRAERTPKGIDASVWPDNAVFQSGNLRVQDVYQVGKAAEKGRQVVSLLDEARKGPPATWFVNFTSGYRTRAFGLHDIPAVSKPVHRALREYLGEHPKGRYGVVLLDLATPDLVRALYETN
ncbi:phosphatidylinositol-specific phospholipase C [Haloferula sargassicola]|uniref:1-phosphatidylinositol phosphodiesterase n=1 Tax=Haloferula sargassicola TaxID=490096 RepID=A0ABP9UMT8_9BACT